MKQIGIFGTSGFARELADIVDALDCRPVFVARDAQAAAELDGGAEVLLESELARHAALPFAIGVGDNGARQRIAQRYQDTLQFVNLIHPAASFGRGQRERLAGRRGLVIGAGARFMNNIEVADFCVVSLNATIGHDCILEQFVLVAPGANISGNVHIGARCWIGTGAAVNQGQNGARLTIGADTTIGSGAVVLGHCDAHAVYAGVPARRIK